MAAVSACVGEYKTIPPQKNMPYCVVRFYLSGAK